MAASAVRSMAVILSGTSIISLAGGGGWGRTSRLLYFLVSWTMQNEFLKGHYRVYFLQIWPILCSNI